MSTFAASDVFRRMKRKTRTRQDHFYRWKDLIRAKYSCPFGILPYWRPRLGCFPDGMHTIGGVIKDLVRMLMAKHMVRSRLSKTLIAYQWERNGVDLRTKRPWEAGEWG